MKVKEQEPEAILAEVIGDDLAAQVVALRESRGRTKKFDAYRARLTLDVFKRASDPRLSAWEYLNRAKNKTALTVEYLRACVTYDRMTGVFTARLPSSTRQEGDVLGSPGSHGYLGIAIAGRSYLAHRLAWFYTNGEWPEQIDHIDNDRQNNALANLRPCSNQENCWNRSSVRGATWNPKRRKWVAKITQNYRTVTLGYFDSEAEAQSRYLAEVERLRGHFLQEAE